jgi:hypothetical protein
MNEDNYKLWYEEAVVASNELGFAGMSAADVIRYQAQENDELKTVCNVNAEGCNEAEDILRNIIKQWESSGDVLGAIQQAEEFLK